MAIRSAVFHANPREWTRVGRLILFVGLIGLLANWAMPWPGAWTQSTHPTVGLWSWLCVCDDGRLEINSSELTTTVMVSLGWLTLIAVGWLAPAAGRVHARRVGTHCPACGYNLEGTTGDRCPECGALLSDATGRG